MIPTVAKGAGVNRATFSSIDELVVKKAEKLQLARVGA